MELTRITPTPQQLRALSHPVRLRMLGLLRAEGPATATGLATRLGLNSGATSYHLRQLATHGFIEDDAGRGNGRERWWRAAHQSTFTDQPATEEERAAVRAFEQSVAVVQTEFLQRAVEEQELLPEAWRRTTRLSDWMVRLTPARAEALVTALERIVEEVDEEEGDGVGDFMVVLQAYPRPGTQVVDPT
ncbi:MULTISPECIES: winged helix-turn-helix domain-containing protein [unclassified Nocardioides]|uniref:winged helix-turn-helix domain-containing protein n=1 Tax=unclassified Nocardioides TaxID=2615069 RepID=UPI0030155E03